MLTLSKYTIENLEDWAEGKGPVIRGEESKAESDPGKFVIGE